MENATRTRRLEIGTNVAGLFRFLSDRAVGLWLRLLGAATERNRSTFTPVAFYAATGRHLRRVLVDLRELELVGFVVLARGVVHDAPLVRVRTWTGEGWADPGSGVPDDRRPIEPVTTMRDFELEARRRRDARLARDRSRKAAARAARRELNAPELLDSLRPFTAAERVRLTRMKQRGVPPFERALFVMLDRQRKRAEVGGAASRPVSNARPRKRSGT